MEAAGVTLVALVGAAVGSFLNVVIHRLPRGESLVAPGSRCPACRAPVKPYDNVPVLSWLVLRGRCRRCGVSIAPRYPAVELLTALAFGAVAVVRGLDLDLVQELPFVAVLVATAGIDVEHRLIPNKILLPAAIFGVVAAVSVKGDMAPELLIAGGAAFLAFLIVALLAPRGMGMGDVKLAGVMGLYLGAAVIPALFAAFLSGSLAGLGIIVARGASARKQAVPFGLFLALGGVVGLLVGTELLDLYRDGFSG